MGGLISGTIGLLGGGPKVKPPNTTQVGNDYTGLLQAYLSGQPDVYGAEREWKPQYIEGRIGDLERYGGRATAAHRAAEDPSSAALRGRLTTAAGDQIALGRSFDDRDFNNSYRASQAARGLGYGPGDAISESVARSQVGEDLFSRRLGFGQSVLQQNQAFDAPALGVMDAGPTIVPQEQNYDLLNTTYNARAAANITNANNQNALIAGFGSE